MTRQQVGGVGDPRKSWDLADVTGALLDPLRRAKAKVVRAPGHWLRRWAVRQVIRRTGAVVASGPFAGMQFVERDVFGAPIAKVLGTYERELHGVIEALEPGGCDAFINIGAAEGYYAVGLARRLPGVPVVAYELLEQGRALIGEAAAKNGMRGRIDVRGRCTREALEALLDPRRRYLVIADVEGDEMELFGPAVVESLERSSLIVESHDFNIPGCTEELVARFDRTHRIRIIASRERRCPDFPLRLAVPCVTKVALMSEGRPARRGPMRWLVMDPR